MAERLTLFPVRFRELWPAAWALVGATFPRLWPLWLVDAALSAAVYGVLKAMQAHGGPLIQQGATSLALAATGAPLGALALPVLLGRQPHPWGWSREQTRYVALEFVLVAMVNGLQMIPAAAFALGWRPDVAISIGTGTLVWGVATWLSLRTSLWPLGVIEGDPRLGLAGSWRATRGAGRTYLGANLAVELPAILAMSIFLSLFYRFGGAQYVIAAGLCLAVADAWAMAVAAAFVRQRLGDIAGTAAVFD